jgi:DnaD/phage-associated family protein
MRIHRYETINTLLEDTAITNIFLELYLPHLSGDCVRVYLYAWMRSQQGEISSNETIAKALGMSVEDLLDAWAGLESEALIRKVYHNDDDKLHFDVVFTDLRGSMFSRGIGHAGVIAGGRVSRADKTAASKLDDENIRDLFREIEQIINRPFPSGDYQKIAELLTEYDIEPDLITRAYGYCMGRGRNPSAAYVREIVRDWSSKGIRTAKEADDHIEIVDMRFGIYRRIMRALGLAPQSLTEGEKAVFDTWLDDYSMSLDDIISATEKAAGKNNKFDYVKRVIENEHERVVRSGAAGSAGGASAGGGPSARAASRRKYYADARRRNEAAAAERRAEVLAALPRVAALESDISRLNLELATLAISGPRTAGGGAEAASLTASLDRIIAEKASVMADGGFPSDYMEIRYDCELCHDTGILDNGASCRCFE